MTDYNLQVTVRNARLLRAVREKFGTGAELARVIGISQSHLSALMTMRERPIREDGGWREVALDIAGALGVEPEELWPGHMAERKLNRSTAEIEITSDQVLQMMAHADDPADLVERQDTVNRLIGCLSERDRSIVEQRMEGATLEELAKESRVGRERIRQIEMRAIRKMRIRAKALSLEPDHLS